MYALYLYYVMYIYYVIYYVINNNNYIDIHYREILSKECINIKIIILIQICHLEIE